MLNETNLTTDQNKVIDRLYNYDETLLVANMGAGKTVCTLTAVKELLADGIITRVLVVAPVKVCQSVWPQEVADWSHLTGLEVADASGSNEKKRRSALDSSAPIVCINFENLAWLFRTYGAKGMFDALVVDELTKLKNSGGTAFKALRPRLKDFKWRLGMTGTPVSENWQGLFGQMLIVDQGKRLGTRKDGYLRRYFYATDYNEYNWALYGWAAKAIAEKINDVVYTMPDYRHELPPLNIKPVKLPLPGVLEKHYETLLKTMAVDVDGGEVAADTAAVLSGKLMQCANGFLYPPTDPEGRREAPIILSDYKIDRCEVAVDNLLSAGEQVVICYWFDADLERLENLYPGCKYSKANEAKFKHGGLDVLLLHPMSAGHGLNLAAGGCKMIWVGPCWSRDLFEQTIARLWRRGQKFAVDVLVLMGSDTIDELIAARVEDKAEYEVLFKQHIGGGR